MSFVVLRFQGLPGLTNLALTVAHVGPQLSSVGDETIASTSTKGRFGVQVVPM